MHDAITSCSCPELGTELPRVSHNLPRTSRPIFIINFFAGLVFSPMRFLVLLALLMSLMACDAQTPPTIKFGKTISKAGILSDYTAQISRGYQVSIVGKKWIMRNS